MVSRGYAQTASALGITTLAFVVGFLLVLPFYLGPDDLARCGQKPDQLHINEACHKSDAIVAISGGDTAARTDEAITLYQNEWAPILIFSGAAQDTSGPSNALAMKYRAQKAGVPESAILIEEASVNTEQNAANTQKLIRENNLKRIVLVTSAYHQRRANLAFAKRAGNEIAVTNHPVAHDKQWTPQWYLTPQGWWLAIGELVKVIGFYVGIE